MKGHGPRSERETIINFNDEEDIAHIWTASETVYRRLLKRLGHQHLAEDGERHALFIFPSKLLVLPRVKTPRTLSPAHRAKLVARMAATNKLLGKKNKEVTS